MNDIIFKINIDESNKILKPVMEIFSGKIKTLKSKKFSGPLKNVDIGYIYKANNLSLAQQDAVNAILNNDENSLISKNKYILSEDNFFELLKALNHNSCLYYTGRDRSLNLIENFLSERHEVSITAPKGNKSLSIIISNEQRRILISKDAIVAGFQQSGLFFMQNTAYYIPEIINGFVLDYLTKNKLNLSPDQFKKISNSIFLENGQIRLLPFIDTLIKHFDVQPQVNLYLRNIEGKISGELRFSYNTIETSANDPGEFIIDGDKKIFRNKNIEFNAQDELKTCNWKKSLGPNYVYEGNSFAEDLRELINKGVNVLSLANKKIALPSNFKINISYNVNWFDITGTVIVENETYDIVEVLHNAKSNEIWVELDGRIIVLPTSLLETKSIFKKDKQHGNALYTEKKYVGDLLDFAESFNIARIKNIENLTEYKNVILDIPPSLTEVLRPYQYEGSKWLMYLYENQFGGCLADDMGLGKTLQVIAFLSDERFVQKSLPSLIVVPKTLLFNWQRELDKFGPELIYKTYYGRDRAENLDLLSNSSINVLLTTYGTLLNDIELLEQFRFNCFIFDEAQYIKNYSSKTYRAALKIQAHNKLAVTGTPVENNIAELWALMNLLNPGVFGNRKEFISKYGDLLNNKNTSQSLNLKTRPFILRRTKSQVLKELPDKIEQNIVCQMEEEQFHLYKNMLENIRNEIERLPDRFEMKSNAIIFKGLLYLRQICCHPLLLRREYNINSCKTSAKFEVFKDLIAELVAANHKVVVFSQFTSMLRIMEKWIGRQGWPYYYLDGKSINRQKIVDGFESAETGIFLVSLKAGGVGLNLTSAQYAIIYDPWWNPAVENQAADRIYRIGQKKNVTIYRLITADSIEEKIEDLKNIKSGIAELILNETGDIRPITKEMLEKLIFE